MSKILTLVYPINSYVEDEINNIKYISSFAKGNFDILILSDNPEINERLTYSLKDEELFIIPSEGNKGKFKLIKDAIDNNSVKTKWFKVCDPDDIVLPQNITKFNENFKNHKKESIIRFYPSINIDKNTNLNDLVNGNNKIEIKKKYMLSLVNENTIHPTIHIKNCNLELPNQSKSSDILLTLCSYIGNKPKVVNFKHSFYYYKRLNGLSNPLSIQNDIGKFEELLTFLDVMIENKKHNKLKQPSYYDYRWAHNFLVSSNLSNEDKIEKAKTVFDKLKICAKQNWKWKVKWNEKEWELYKYKIIKGEKIDYE